MNDKMMMMIAGWLVVIGGLNWGLVGLLNINIVEMIFGSGMILTRIIYVLIGISAIYVGMMMGQKKMK
jgi:uncharacterized membrane protein YuzA (DUF378 family)